MRTTAKPLASIAAEAGFFDQSHFCRVFGDAFGMAPRRFPRRVLLSNSEPLAKGVQEL